MKKYYDKLKAQVAEMEAEKKKQADTNKMIKDLSGRRDNYVPPQKGPRKNFSDVINKNLDKNGRALPSSYQNKTQPEKSPSPTELLRAKAGDLLASAMGWKETVSKQATQHEPSKKHTSGLSKGRQ